jgi:parallel beta-helix repeat protein
MTNRIKTTTVVLLIALFAANCLCSVGTAGSKAATINVYSGQTIQDAVNAAKPGDTIIVHEGTYTEQVTVMKPLTLISQGATLVTPSSWGFNVEAPAVISGFKIQPIDDDPYHAIGIRFDSFNTGGAAAINNEISSGFSVAGITVNGPTGIRIANNVIHSSSSGIDAYTSSGIVMSGNTIDANNFGIWIVYPPGKISDLTITGNTIHSTLGDGIFVSPGLGASGVVISNNKVTTDSTGDYKDGIHVMNTKDVAITANEILTGDEGHGISAEVSNADIEGNVAHAGENAAGIMVSNSINCRVVGNEASGTTGIGLMSSTACQITSNKATGRSYGLGIGLQTDSDVVVTNNEIINVEMNENHDTGRGIDLSDCSSVLVSGNKITVVEWGLSFYRLTNAVISANDITTGPKIIDGQHYGTYGIIFADSSFCTISNNAIKNAQYSGIYGYGNSPTGCHDMIVQGNVMTSDPLGSTVGIRLQEISKSTVSSNSIAGTYHYGVDLDTGSNTNTISRNTLELTGSNIAGIWLDGSTFSNVVKNNKISGTAMPIQDLGVSNTIKP